MDQEVLDWITRVILSFCIEQLYRIEADLHITETRYLLSISAFFFCYATFNVGVLHSTHTRITYFIPNLEDYFQHYFKDSHFPSFLVDRHFSVVLGLHHGDSYETHRMKTFSL